MYGMRRLKKRKSWLLPTIGLGWLVLASFFFFGCGDGEGPEAVVAQVESHDWKSPQSCRACHEEEYQQWLRSHHAIANREMDSSLDAEAFAAGGIESANGKRYKVGETDGRYFITPSEEDAQRGEPDAEVVAAIGEYPLRQYLAKGRDGRLQAHAMSWDTEKKEWFDVFGEEERSPHDWGHWSSQGMNWNSNCAFCHMTEYDKGYDAVADSYHSTWTSQAITCIACHTGLEGHAERAREETYEKTDTISRALHMENCASCHARREEISPGNFEAGERFHDHFRLMLPDHPTAYFLGGQANEENYVYGSLMLSRMGEMGVSCLDCHNPHSHELILPTENNALCMQCHAGGVRGASVIDQLAHSGHPAGSSGNQCIECHMPSRTYMARDPRRDHGFTIPDPYLTREYGTPNACSSCHEEEGLEWVEASFDRMYGAGERVAERRLRASVMHAVREGELDSPEPILQQLEGETNDYWRAAWLRLLLPFREDGRVQDLARRAIESESALLRSAGYELTGSREAAEDPARLVRIRAMDTLFSYQARSEEWRQYARNNADRVAGALRMAEWAQAERRVEDLVMYAERAVAMDRNTALVRYDVAILLDRAGLGEQALKHLKVGSALDPRTGLYDHAIGLVLAEMEDYAGAAVALKRALVREPEQDRWWYTLAIAQTRAGDVGKARESLARALELAPENAEYRVFAEQLGLDQ